MIVYWSMFGLAAVGAVQFARDASQARSRAVFGLIVALLVLVIGLRYEVGGDWETYQNIFDRVALLQFGVALTQSDIGYAFVNWLGVQIGVDVWFANLVCAIMVMMGVGRLCSQQPNPFLGLTIAIPYMIIVVAMGYTRQAAAIGLVCMAITSRPPHQIGKAVAWVIVATLMHKTAILALPILLVPTLKRNVVAAAGGAVIFAGAFVFALRDTAESMLTNYVEGSYDSSGAAVRIAMNVASAVLFLGFRNRFGFDAVQRNYWTTSSWLAVAAIIALPLLPSSSGLDRISLFLIPLQIAVLSRLPYIVRPGTMNREVLLLVIIYSGLVQAIWLLAGTHASSWLPYRTVVGQWFGMV